MPRASPAPITVGPIATTGALSGVPHLKDFYYDELDREQWGLVPVAQLDSYRGLIFATFDPAAPPLRQYLGEMAWYLDVFFDRREGGVEVLGAPINGSCRATGNSRPRISAATPTTCSGRICRRSPPASAAASPPSPKPTGSMLSPGNGHMLISSDPTMYGDPPMPAVQAYERTIRPEVEQAPRLRAIG